MLDWNAWRNMPKLYVVNQSKMDLLNETQRKLQEIIDEEFLDCEVEISPCPLGFGDAILSFETDSIVCRDMAKFCLTVMHMDNFEIYPLENGNIRFAGVISDVAKLIPTINGYSEEV